VLSQGDLEKSLKPKASQCKGWSNTMGKTGGKKTSEDALDTKGVGVRDMQQA
jgi:hypothetical protein